MSDFLAILLGTVGGAVLTFSSRWLVWRAERRRAHERELRLERELVRAQRAGEQSRLAIELLDGGSADADERPGPTAPDLPRGLAASCLAGECVLFVGTGAAASAGQPTWREALLSVLGICRYEHPDPLWERLAGELREDQYDLVVDLLVDRLGRARLFELLREVVAKRPREERGPLLEGLAEIPFAGVITNLWDDLARELYARRSPDRLLRDVPSDLVDHLRERRFFVLPAFGAIGDDSLLLTNDELSEYLEDHGAFKRFLGSIFGTRSVLFIGTGVAGIEQLLRSSGLRGPGRREHYALVPRTPEAELHQRRLATRYNVQLVLYEPTLGHSQAADFVGALAEQTQGGEQRRDRARRSGEALRSVHLRNIGPFEEIELDFAEDWTVVLGNNGCGKSTILRAIGLAMAGDDERALRNGGRLLAAGEPSGSIEVRFDRTTFETRLRRERTRVSATARQITPVQTGEWLVLGFPPVRGLSIRTPDEPASPMFAGPSVDDVLPLVVGGADDRLDDVTQWLLNAFAADAVRGGGEARERVPKAVARFFSVMSRLSDHADSDEPYYAFDGLGDDLLDVLVRTPDGRIPLKQLSQGMLSVLSWTGTLITRLEDLRRDGELPERCAALVLVDELDAHLHPTWQRTIAGAVRKEFPNVQVVATTHSPLVVGSMAEGMLWRLHRDRGRVESERLDPQRYIGRRFDQILGAAPFDETSARDPETERMLDDYARYVGRDDLEPAEVEQLDKAVAALDLRLPSPVERDEVRQAQELIARAADDRLAAMPVQERARVLSELRRQLHEAIHGSSPSR